MTLAAISIEEEDADAVIARFREVSGWSGEVKGSRINLSERAQLFELLAETSVRLDVAIAISATKPVAGEDRGDHDVETYARLLEAAVGAALLHAKGGAQVIMDDGRYGPKTLSLVRQDIAELLGPRGSARMELSHKLSGLQLADVIANSFFNRAMPTQRQGRMAAIVAPMLESGRIVMQVVAPAEH